MKLLAIDTSAEGCSAALYRDGEIDERFLVQPRSHSELILGMMEDLLRRADLALGQLDALAFGCGPGSFTGVRIATGVMQGTAYATGLPIVPVSTLAALAQRHVRETGASRILPAYDARMGEVYWGAYEVGDKGLVSSVGAERVCRPDTVPLPIGDGWEGVGSGWLSYRNELEKRLKGRLGAIHSRQLCSAHDVAVLGVAGFRAGACVASADALPVYLRNRVASKPGAGH